jgi:hypothetical protein
MTMIVRRCAWHRAYHWYPMTIGIASWRGRGVAFTDGMCRGCAIRFRRQWNLPAMPSRAFRLAPASAFVRGAVTVATVIVLVLGVRASDSSRPRATMTPPPETVLVPTPIVEPAPAVPERPAPRRARPAVSRPAPSVVVAGVAKRPAPAAPSLAFPETETDTDAIVLTAMAEPADATEPTRVSATWSRFPAMSVFAALPNAGLTQQAP